MIHFWWTLVCLMSGLIFIGQGFASEPLATETRQLKQRLLERKKSFDQHMAWQEKRRAQREARADEQRRRREAYFQAKESARAKFKRPAEVFPVVDYRSFLQKRERRQKQIERSRQDFVERQKVLRQIESDHRYLIDGKKEYQL